MGILSAILWTPAIGALILALIAGRDADVARNLGKLFASITFLLTCYLLSSFDPHNAGLQFSEYFSINPKVGSAYALGVDGLALPVVGLATLLTAMVVLVSSGVASAVKGYLIGTLLAELGMVGLFLSQGWGLYYIFGEIALIPMFFLIDR